MPSKAHMTGILKELEYDHSVTIDSFEEKFYRGVLSIVRASKIEDRVPFMISEKLFGDKTDYLEKMVHIEGSIRSKIKDRFLVFIFAKSISLVEEDAKYQNIVEFSGFLCKEPVFRTTPSSKREITDLFFAIHRDYFKKSDYVPAICWGKNAIYTAELPLGTELFVRGRFQSREYQKVVEEVAETRTTYEVSVNFLQKIEKEEPEEVKAEETEE